jgi:drug/metabolite transporter (DMT)-like permease
MSRKTAVILVLLAAVMWGLTGLFSINLKQMGFTATEMSTIRSFLSLIIAGVVFFIKDRNIFKIHSLKDLAILTVTCFFGYTIFIVAYVVAVNETSMAVACVLMYTFPAFIILFSAIFLKEKVTKKKIAVMLMVFVGCVMVSGIFDGEVRNFTTFGLLCGLFSGISFAFYSMASKALMKKYSTETILFYMFVISSVFFIFTGHPTQVVAKTTQHGAWGWMISFALAISFVPYIIYLKGLTVISASEAGIIASIEPIVSTIAGILLFGESINLLKVCGIAVVVIAIAYMNMPERKENKNEA